MPIQTRWHILARVEDQVTFKLAPGIKGYVFNGLEQLISPYMADDLGDRVVTVPLLNAITSNVRERAKAAGDRLTSKNWFGFNIVDGIMNLVTSYDHSSDLVRYGLFYTNMEVIPCFSSKLAEFMDFEWESRDPMIQRVSRYDRKWVI